MTVAPSATCPSCGAPRTPGPECPRCGVIYAKARARAAPPLAPPAAAPAPEPPDLDPADLVGDARGLLPGQEAAVWGGDLEDARREVLVRTWAPPVALGLAAIVVASDGVARMIFRTFFSMWLHESGHAIAAWLSGYFAFPGPWRTPISPGRIPFVIVLLAAALLALAAWGWRVRRPALVVAGAGGLFVQVVCTLLPAREAETFFTFGGDAGCMLLGAALFATIWSSPEGKLAKNWLRWGFLVIGAFGLADPLGTWIRGALDHAQIPLGEIENVGLSDPSKLQTVSGWTLDEMASRYVALGVACLVALAAGYALGLRRARRRLREAEAAGLGAG